MIEGIGERIRARAEEALARNDDAHGFPHAERVAGLSEKIRKHEGGDFLVLSASSYMHDLCVSQGYSQHVSEPALLIIREELLALEFPLDKSEQVIHAIKHHEDYDFLKKGISLSKEGQILQDADRLDALGAIGVARCFYTTSSLGNPIGTLEDMHGLEEPYHAGQRTSAIQHFHTKLLHLKDNMNTEYARQLAQGRHDFLVEYLRRYKLESEGKL